MKRDKLINSILLATLITSILFYLPYVILPNDDIESACGVGEIVGKYYQPDELSSVAGVDLSINNIDSDEWVVIYKVIETGELKSENVAPEYYHECELGDTVTISYNGAPIELDWDYKNN